MQKGRRTWLVPPPSSPPPSTLQSLSVGVTARSVWDVPDVVVALALSWLDLHAHLQVCRLSRRFRRLTRLRSAAPSCAHLYPTTQSNDLTGRTARAVDWLVRAAPTVVALDVRRAAAANKQSLDVVDVDNVDASATAWSQAVASVARTLRLLGPASHAFAFLSEIARSATLVHLELRVTVAPHDGPRQLPDLVFSLASLRSLTCSDAIAVTSAQVARLTHLTALDIERVAGDRRRAYRDERRLDGLLASDAAILATHGRLCHLRLRCAHERNLRALAATALGARLETLGVPGCEVGAAWTETFPRLMSRLQRFATTWLSDRHAAMLATRAPALTALELRPRTQRVMLRRRRGVDGKLCAEEDEEAVAGGGGGGRSAAPQPTQDRDDSQRTPAVDQTRLAFGVCEPPAGLGLMRSLARHLPHLRELVLMRHHADLGPLAALSVLTRLVCCDRPIGGAANATRWPDTLSALVELRVIDITRRPVGRDARPPSEEQHAKQTDTSGRRRMLTARFPRLAYLRFVSLEDEIGDEHEYVRSSQLTLYGDAYFEPVCREPDNGHAAFRRRSEFPELRANDVRVSSAFVRDLGA